VFDTFIVSKNASNEVKCLQKSGSGRPRLVAVVLLRSEIPSGMCAKLRTVAASNNRDHARNLSYYCLLALHI